MKYLKSFNESEDFTQVQIIKQVFDVVKHCFLEFEDNGWFWKEDITSGNWIKLPYFSFVMVHDEDVYTPARIREYYIDWTGFISSDGNIDWSAKDISDENLKDINSGYLIEEANDFLVSVKRINQEIGLDFHFSYNNRGGDKRIVINGRI